MRKGGHLSAVSEKPSRTSDAPDGDVHRDTEKDVQLLQEIKPLRLEGYYHSVLFWMFEIFHH